MKFKASHIKHMKSKRIFLQDQAHMKTQQKVSRQDPRRKKIIPENATTD